MYFRFYFCFLVILLFLAMSNKLSVLSLDKFAFLLFSFLFASNLLVSQNFTRVAIYNLCLGVLFLLYLLFSASFSLSEMQVLSADYYLVFFFAAIMVVNFLNLERDYLLFLKVFSCSASIYIVLGVIFWGYSVLTKEIFFVQPLYGKGMPDTFAALSFATTQQVYATFSALLLIVIFFLNRNGLKVAFYKPLFLLCIVAIVVSLNRVWLVFLLIFLGLYFARRLVYLMIPSAFLFAIFLFLYSDVMLSTGTVESRFMMMEYSYNFFVEQDFWHILWGRPFYQGAYFYMHGREFDYIESGPFFIMINFGVVGFVLFSLVFFIVIFRFFKVSFFLGFLSLYYFIPVQFMTQEYLSISFWLFWIVVFAVFYLERNKSVGVGCE